MKLLCVSNSSICCFAGAWRYISSVPHCHRPTWCWQGHWIAAIGQLPVMVKGAIACNDFIVASVTDPPMGQSLNSVTTPMAQQPVVALCLESKESEALGKVMAFVLFALPAISQLVQVASHCSVIVVLFAAK